MFVKNMVIKTIVYLSILVLCALEVEGGTVKPHFSLMSGYDDNITLQPTAQQEDMFFSLIPGIRFKTDDKILFVTLNAQGKYIAYRKYTEHNRTDCSIKNTLEWHPVPYEFLLTGEYLKGEEVSEETLISLNKYYKTRFSNISRYKASKSSYAEFSYNIEKIDWKGIDIDNKLQIWGLRIQPTTIFGLKYQDIVREFEDNTKFSQEIVSLILSHKLNKKISAELEVKIEEVTGMEKDVYWRATLLYKNPIYSLTLNYKSGYILPYYIQSVEDRKSFEIKTKYQINRSNSIEAYFTEIDHKLETSNNEQINEIKGIFTHQMGRDILCRVMASYWKKKPDFTDRRVVSVAFVIRGE